ncbi:MAG: hypothetical protein ACE5NJ_01780 [Thermodesulfobacteriota bacterium]
MQEFLIGYFGVSLKIGGAMIETSARGPSYQKEGFTAWWNKSAKSPVCFPQLPVGGIKGRVLAAKGAGIYTVVLSSLIREI